MLHDVIQAAFGWDDTHMHAFEIGNEQYGNPETDIWGELDFIDESKVRLTDLVRPGQKFCGGYKLWPPSFWWTECPHQIFDSASGKAKTMEALSPCAPVQEPNEALQRTAILLN